MGEIKSIQNRPLLLELESCCWGGRLTWSLLSHHTLPYPRRAQGRSADDPTYMPSASAANWKIIEMASVLF